MKKTLLLLSAIILLFAGCKKDDVIEASKVEIKNERVERGWDYLKFFGEYSYPQDLEGMKFYLSENADMSGAKSYSCVLEGRDFACEATDLKAGKKYHYYIEYDNGYEKHKNEVAILNTVAKPVVTTKTATDVTAASAFLNGSVTNSDAANKIQSRGFCWSTSQNPDMDDEVVNNGSSSGTGTSTFTHKLENLTENTTYYYRAYTTTNYGTVYGEEKSFKTVEITMPAVATSSVTDITATSAKCGGNVTFDGNGTVTARGVCWSANPNPTINDNKTSNGSGTGTFTSNLTNLTENTTYYVRAYATNEKGTSYGEEKSFKTLEITMPAVTTGSVTDIKANSAECGGNVTSDGNGTVTASGVCWSTNPNPTINDNKTTDGSGTGSFTSNLTNLTANTTYYVRAYATNEKGTSYGEEKSFKTKSLTGTINGHDWVDLGLPSGLKWATCNVGASSPEDYGDYFAWGETETKTEYTQDNSLTSGLTISELQSQGYIDGSGNLTPSHDAATANWGGSWRMPTEAELEELKNICTWTWITQNGVKGYNVTGPNGNHIFLPAAGYRGGSSLYDAGELGSYWSSSPYGINSDVAYGLHFNSDGQLVGWSGRNRGRSVRPVSE